VPRPQPSRRLRHLGLIQDTMQRVLIENRAWVNRANARSYRCVENSPSSVRRRARLGQEARALFHLCLVRFASVRDVDQKRFGGSQIVDDDVIEECRCTRIATRLQRVKCFVDRSDAGQAVGVDEPVIQIAHG
jgi:hypothetical protein